MKKLQSSILSEFKGITAMIIGDVMLDRYLFGKIERISPEAPIPIVDLVSNESRLGGAANVALNLKALGANPILVSMVGKDQRGHELIDMLPKFDIDNSCIAQSAYRPTTVKSRILASNQQVLRIDDELKQDLNEIESKSIIAQYRHLLSTQIIDVIVLQDYNKGLLTAENIKEIIAEANRMDIPVAVDPKKQNFWGYTNCNLFKPNLEEVRAVVPFRVDPEINSLDKANAYLKERLNNDITMITLSSKGVYLNDGNKSNIYPTTARKIADVCGAGDSVISIASLALACKHPIEWMGILANLCGGQVCEKVGVVSIDIDQLGKEIEKAQTETEKKQT